MTTSMARGTTLEDLERRLVAMTEQLGGLRSEVTALRTELTTHNREKEGLDLAVVASNGAVDALARRIGELHTLMSDVGRRGLTRHDVHEEVIAAMAKTVASHGRKLDQIIDVLETLAGVKKVAARRISRPPKKPRT